MRHAPNIKRTVAAVAGVVLAHVAAHIAPAAAAPLPVPNAPPTAEVFHLVAADCYAIGQQVAAQEGGTLAKASPATEGGQPVCRIVVLLPAKDGQRPRRAEFVVPQN
jgi:hypothetical protein